MVEVWLETTLLRLTKLLVRTESPVLVAGASPAAELIAGRFAVSDTTLVIEEPWLYTTVLSSVKLLISVETEEETPVLPDAAMPAIVDVCVETKLLSAVRPVVFATTTLLRPTIKG